MKFTLFLTLSALTSSLMAASYGFAPMRINMTSQSTIFELKGDKTEFDARIVEWTQDGKGKDIEVATKDIRIKPVIKGPRQEVIRLAKGYSAPAVEKAYALYLSQDEDIEHAGKMIKGKTTYRFPVFVKPATENRSTKIVCGKNFTTITNNGNVHEKFILKSLNAQTYILPGNTVTIKADYKQLVDVFDDTNEVALKCNA